MNFSNISLMLVEKRSPIFWLTLFLTLAFSTGAMNVSMESDYKAFFSADNPQLIAHENVQERYTDTDNLFLVVTSSNDSVFSVDVLRAVARMTALAWETPHSLRVDSLTNYQYSYGKGEELIVEDLVKLDGDFELDLQRIEKIALAEPLLVNNLVSDDGMYTAVNIMLAMPDTVDVAVREIVAYGRTIKSEIESDYPGISVSLQGTSAVNHAFIESSEKDAASLMPLMFVVILMGLVWWLKSFKATFITLLVINLSTAVAIGFCGWFGIKINQVNVIAPTVIMTLAICDCVHILVAYIQKLGKGIEPSIAMQESLNENLKPVFLTSFTTAVGFLCINFSESPPLAEMGTITAVGIMAAFLLSITLLPFLTIKFMKDAKPIATSAGLMLDKLAVFVARKRNGILIGSVLVVCSALYFMFQNDIDDNYIKYFSDNTQIRQGANLTQENLTGIDTLAFSLSSGAENGISDPQFLKAVEAFVSWAMGQPEVVHVDNYVDVIKRLNRNMHNEDEAWFSVPEDRELAAQYLLLYEMSLPFGLDLNNLISFDKSSLLVNLRLKVDKAKDIVALDEKAQRWFEEYYPDLATNGASVSLMFAHLGKSNITNMMYGNVVGIFIISLTLMLALASFRYGLISLIPNAVPAILAFGVWGALVGEVNIAVAVVFSVTLGIVVDDTVHFLTKYLSARRELNYSAEQSIRYAFQSVGKALVITSIVLAIGFFVLAFSDFTVNSTMGLMVGVTILIAIIFDFLFLPALLLKMDDR